MTQRIVLIAALATVGVLNIFIGASLAVMGSWYGVFEFALGVWNLHAAYELNKNGL